jgi:hypothetical protein
VETPKQQLASYELVNGAHHEESRKGIKTFRSVALALAFVFALLLVPISSSQPTAASPYPCSHVPLIYGSPVPVASSWSIHPITQSSRSRAPRRFLKLVRRRGIMHGRSRSLLLSLWMSVATSLACSIANAENLIPASVPLMPIMQFPGTTC